MMSGTELRWKKGKYGMMSTKRLRIGSQGHGFLTLSQLGTPLSEYTCVFSFMDMIKIFLLLVGMSGCVWAMLTQPASFNKITGPLTLIYFIMFKMITLAFFLFALVQLWYGIRRFLARHDKIIVYDEGFVSFKKDGYCAIPWHEIAAIRQTKKTWSMTGSSPLVLLAIDIQLHDGSALCLDNTFRDVENFWQVMEKAVMAHLLPQAITTYMKGGDVQFGDIMVNQQGIMVCQSFLPWQRIKKIAYTPKMSIWQTRRMRRWAAIPLDRVPNVAVLKALIAFHMDHAL
jgi:hypothetical protein